MKKKSNYFDKFYQKSNFDRVNEIAFEEGLTVRFPKDNELFIDIDTNEKYLIFLDQLKILRRFKEAFVIYDEPSMSGNPHRHIIVELKETITPLERLLLQTILGSDSTRELLGYIQLKNGENNVTAFLEEK